MSAQRPAGVRDERASVEAGFGVQGSHGGAAWVPGVTSFVALDTGGGSDVHLRFVARGSYDVSGEAIDVSRHELWGDGRGELGLLPRIDAGGSAAWRLGAVASGEYFDNTPTSIDKSFRVLAGPAAVLETARWRFAATAGAHVADVEIDDDLPRLRGIPRDELIHHQRGLGAAGTLRLQLDGWAVGVTGRVLADSEARLQEGAVGLAVDVPLHRGARHGRHLLRLSVEERFLDADTTDVLPFLRDGFVRFEYVVGFGGRSPRTWGY